MFRHMTEKEFDLYAYQLAKDFLLKNTPPEVDENLLRKYLNLSRSQVNLNSKNDIYFRLLESAQNTNMKTGVIGRAIGGVKTLGNVLNDFNPDEIVSQYGEDSEKLMETIFYKVDVRGKKRTESNSIWPSYCKTILSAALFLKQFKDLKDFQQWVDENYKDQRTFAAVPFIISYEIYGISLALACDFLKELGYDGYGKPDIHVKNIFKAIGLCRINSNDYQVLKAIRRIAENVGQTAYHVDKLFWLIGSGKFYNNPEIGNKGMTGRRADEFIKFFNNEVKMLQSNIAY